MKRVIYWLNAVLFTAVIVLAFAVWRQSQERNRWQERVSTAVAKIAQLRKTPEMSPPVTLVNQASTQAASEAPKVSAEKASKATNDPARSEQARLAEERKRRQFRLNALNGYATGFDALKIPPENVARAKEIILQGWELSAAIEKKGRSSEEVMAEHEAVRVAMNARLTALLGKDTFEELEAYDREGHFDWTVGTDLWDGGAPLTTEQLHALTLAIVRLDYSDQLFVTAPKSDQVPDPTTWLSQQDNQLLEAAHQFLAPYQRKLLRQNLIEENRYNAAMRDEAALRRQRSKPAP